MDDHKYQTSVHTDDRIIINGRNDVRTHRIIVISLGTATCLSIIGVIILAGLGRDVPSELIAIGSMATGSLATSLAVVMGFQSNNKDK